MQEADLFAALGPVAVFNSSTQFHPPRSVTLHAAPKGYGMVLIGSTPVM